MTAPAIAPSAIGESQLSNRWMVEVDTASSQSDPSWVGVFGRKSFTYAVNPTTVDNSDSDTGQWSSNFTVGLGWTATLAVEHKLYDGVEDAGQAFLRRKAAPTGQNGKAEAVHIRFWDIFGGEEVYEGWANPTWTPSGAEKDSDKATVGFAGQGALYGPGDIVRGEPLANPKATNTVAHVDSVAPAGAAQGELVQVKGANLLGATQVKFGATNALDYDVVHNGVIVAVVPAGSAGTVNVTVVNATGTSNAVPYVRGA